VLSVDLLNFHVLDMESWISKTQEPINYVDLSELQVWMTCGFEAATGPQ
jgi:hypothetical protein